ncbi:hypothetical protein HYV84_01390 [Candidatus Woesearchaeota archaeon]|nr:hypothetical protein [Candidatus Woesearchaeota archaeon]
MKVPPLIKGMAFAPLMGALVASDSRAAGRDLSIYLSEDVFRGDSPFFYEVDRRVVTPALTIDGKATPEKVLELQEKYGKRPVVKFKIGTKGLEEEIAFILDILGNHLPHRPYFILDANQAHSPESCGRVLERLAHAGYLEKLLFLEQPSKVGEEPNGFDTMYAGISPGIRISWDESVASVSDIKRLSERIGGRQAPDVLIVPKFEKLGLVEFVEMFAAADNYGFRVTPSTLTGPPNQWALFAYLAERLPCFTLPGNPRAIPVEANGYEILRWREIAQALSFPTGDRILSEREPILDTCIQHDGIPDVARTVGLDKMPHSLVFRPS